MASTLFRAAGVVPARCKKIKETGTITIGHRDSSIPFSYYDENQKGRRLRDGHLHEGQSIAVKARLNIAEPGRWRLNPVNIGDPYPA
jgi:hypothetical protein